MRGSIHDRQQCSAYGKQCRACGKLNHFQKVCRSSRKPFHETKAQATCKRSHRNSGRLYFTCNPQQQQQQQYFTRNTRRQRVTNEQQTFVIDSVGSSEAAEIKEMYSTIQINDHDVKLKVDTGARCNVMPFNLFKQVRRSEKIDNSRPVQLVSYSGDSIQTLGETVFRCCFAGKTHNLKFHVIEKTAKPLIGLEDSLSLQLIQLKDVHEIKPVPSQITTKISPWKMDE